LAMRNTWMDGTDQRILSLLSPESHGISARASATACFQAAGVATLTESAVSEQSAVRDSQATSLNNKN
jgi:hypothetical protein